MFIFGLRLLFQLLNWIDSADNEERPRVRQTLVAADRDQTIFLLGEDRQRRWPVLRWNPHLQQAERVADMEAGRSLASYSAVGAGYFMHSSFFRHHQTEESIFVVGAGGQVDGRVDEFLVREGRWRERAPLAVGRWGHAAAVVKVPIAAAAADGEETLIGVFGGSKSGFLVNPISSCEVYEVRQDRWHTLPDLPEGRWASAAACLPGDSRVFVFGGQDERDTCKTDLASVVFCHLRADWRRLEATSADFWQSAAPMRTARWGLAATAFRGVILVAGGWHVNTVEMFTPPDASSPLGQWTELAHMKESRLLFTLLASTNAVFALGGRGCLGNTVEAFTAPGGSTDPDNDLTAWVWSSKRPVESLSEICGAASICM
ncbi:Kelch-like protein 12 [Sparganum proliferum]